MLFLVCWCCELLGTKLAFEVTARVYFPVMFVVDLEPVAYPSTEGAFHGFPFSRRSWLGRLLSVCFAGALRPYLPFHRGTWIGGLADGLQPVLLPVP